MQLGVLTTEGWVPLSVPAFPNVSVYEQFLPGEYTHELPIGTAQVWIDGVGGGGGGGQRNTW